MGRQVINVRGVLETGTLSDFLRWVCLIPGLKKIVFSPGFLETTMILEGDLILHLESTSPRGIFGQYLVRKRYLSPEQLQEARKEQREKNEYLINIILRRRWLNPEQLAKILTERIVDVILSFRMLPDITFSIRSLGEGDHPQPPLWRGVSIQQILERLQEREPVWTGYLDVYPAMSRTVFKPVEGRHPVTEKDGDPLRLQIFRAIDGRYSILEIARLLGELEYDVLAAVAHLHHQGVIEVVGEALPEIVTYRTEPGAEELIETILQRLRENDVEGAANLMDYLEKTYSAFAEKVERLRQVVSQKLTRYYEHMFPDRAIPRLRVSMSEINQYDLDEMLAFMVSRIDGLNPIHVLKNLIPVHEGRFYRMMKTLVALGIVEIVR